MMFFQISLGVVSVGFTLAVGWYAGIWWGIGVGIVCVVTSILVVLFVYWKIDQLVHGWFYDLY